MWGQRRCAHCTPSTDLVTAAGRATELEFVPPQAAETSIVLAIAALRLKARTRRKVIATECARSERWMQYTRHQADRPVGHAPSPLKPMPARCPVDRKAKVADVTGGRVQSRLLLLDLSGSEAAAGLVVVVVVFGFGGDGFGELVGG